MPGRTLLRGFVKRRSVMRSTRTIVFPPRLKREIGCGALDPPIGVCPAISWLMLQPGRAERLVFIEEVVELTGRSSRGGDLGVVFVPNGFARLAAPRLQVLVV
jgi:hypothetical protein